MSKILSQKEIEKHFSRCASLSIPNIEIKQAKEYDSLVNYLETFKND